MRVKVHVRLRPVQSEASGDAPAAQDGAAEPKGKLLYLHDSEKKVKSEFLFDTVLPSATSQADLFTTVGHPLVQHVLSGHNACCFAYGSTGSGKTHSIHGQVHPVACHSTWLPHCSSPLAQHSASAAVPSLSCLLYTSPSPRD